MSKQQRIKDLIGYIKDHLENLQYGYDWMDDDTYVIKYKDSTHKYIYGYDVEEGISLNVQKIDYIVATCGEDSWDSNGKS